MMEMLSYGFMQNALIAGVLTGIACGVVGSLVVVNRLVMTAGGIAHAAYGGVGMAFYFGLPVMPVVFLFSAVIGLISAAATLKRSERSDTVVGILWAVGMAVGIVFLDATPGYRADLMSYLFGGILAVPAGDIFRSLVMNIVLLGIIAWKYRELLAFSQDKDFAEAAGVPVKTLHFLLFLMISIAVVQTIQVVGLILVIALMTIPCYLAEKQSKSLKSMMLLSCLYNCAFVVAGIVTSYYLNASAGAVIILIAAAYFLLDASARALMRRLSMSRQFM
jgi:zinc transport system permease protein